MSKSCSANRTRSIEQPKEMSKESKSANASTWENHPNERQFLDSLSRFMNESWAAVSQVRERTGLNPQYQMSSTEISKRIGEVSKKLDDKYREVQALEIQKTQLLNKSGPSKGYDGPRIAAMRPAPGSPGPGGSRDPRYGYPDSFDSTVSSYGVPRATSSPAHQDTLELSYSGNYSYGDIPEYDDWGYWPSGSSGTTGSPGRSQNSSGSGGPIPGESACTATLDSSRSATPRSPFAPSTDASEGSWNSPHQGRRSPPPRCPAARGGTPGPRRARWQDSGPQQPYVAPRRSPSPAPPVDRGWGAHVVTYDHTPSSEYSTEVSSLGSPRTDPSSVASPPRSPPQPVDRGWGVPHVVNYDRTPSTEYSTEVSSVGQSPCQQPPCRNARTPEYSSRSEQSAGSSPRTAYSSGYTPSRSGASSPAYSPRSEYSTGRSSSGLSSHPDSSRGTASRSWNSRVSSGASPRSGHQFSPGASDRSAAEALCHPECLGLPYNYRVGAMRE